jgi:hypothetical protein
LSFAIPSQTQCTHPRLLLRSAASLVTSLPRAPTTASWTGHPGTLQPNWPYPMIPYPRPCLATTPPSQNRAPDGEPPQTSPVVEPDRFAPPSVARSMPLPPPLADAWARTHDVCPRRSASPWAGWAACPCPRSLGRNPPPSAQLAENSLSFSFFHFFFLISYIYILIFYAPKIV